MTDTRLFEDFIRETMEMNDLPGLAIGVSLEGEHWTGAEGVRDFETKDPLTAGDVFHCASVSKLFTSTAIMKLIDEGVLGYEDRLVDILPDLGLEDERAEKILLWHMLSHVSGIGDVDDYHWEQALTSEEALKNYVYSDEVRKLPMLWEPGKGGFRYSNIAYEILGHIVSEKSAECGEKTSYEDFIKKHIMEPVGMDDSTMKTFERIGVEEGKDCPLITDEIRRRSLPMALPHEKAEDRNIVPVRYYPYTRSHGPSSTLTSTTEDLLKWGDVSNAGFRDMAAGDGRQEGKMEGILSQEAYQHSSYEYATVPNNGEKMGLGWFMREQRGYRLLGHEGTDDGFRASFWICPEKQLTIAVLSNLSGAPVKKINRKLFDRMCEEGI